MIKKSELIAELFHNFFEKKEFQEEGKLLNLHHCPVDKDFYETNTDWVATIKLPDLDETDLEVSLEHNLLEVKVNKISELKKEDLKTGLVSYCKEVTSFYKSIPLPETASERFVKNYKNGVLEVKIAKKVNI